MADRRRFTNRTAERPRVPSYFITSALDRRCWRGCFDAGSPRLWFRRGAGGKIICVDFVTGDSQRRHRTVRAPVQIGNRHNRSAGASSGDTSSPISATRASRCLTPFARSPRRAVVDRDDDDSGNQQPSSTRSNRPVLSPEDDLVNPGESRGVQPGGESARGAARRPRRNTTGACSRRPYEDIAAGGDEIRKKSTSVSRRTCGL